MGVEKVIKFNHVYTSPSSFKIQLKARYAQGFVVPACVHIMRQVQETLFCWVKILKLHHAWMEVVKHAEILNYYPCVL